MGFFDKIKQGLAKTRNAMASTLGSVFSGFSQLDDDFYDELEESLILADLGVDTALKATERLRKVVREQHLKEPEEAKAALKEILVDMLSVGQSQLDLSTKPAVILVIGVNGVGKINTKPVRMHALDGAIFPYIMTFTYEVDGIQYKKRKYIGLRADAISIFGNVDVYYDKDKPSKCAIKL